jgi:hypothetical protein
MKSHGILSVLPAIFLTVGLLVGVALAQNAAPLPLAPGAHIVTISPPGDHGSEPGITVNPKNPNQVVAVYQPATATYSTDGGQTFALADLPPVPGWKIGGDVSTTFDNKGHVFLSSLHFDKLSTLGYWGHGAGRNGIFVRRSLDGGKTWEKDPTQVIAWKGGEPDIQWEDMPRIIGDNVPTSPYAGNLYVGWIEWQLTQSVILFARSTDDGKTFSTPIRISTHAGLPRDDNGGLVGFLAVIDAEGTIYATWNDGLAVAFTTSRDGGKTFAPSRLIFDVGPPYFGGAVSVPGVARVMGFPQIGVDPRPGKGANLYVAWSDFRNGDVDVFNSTSTDHGQTWTPPMRVNNDPIHDGIDQFFQWMAVDPITGDVYVQFYDRRSDADNRKTWVTLARSTDAGKTFTNYQWTSEPFESELAFLGDYTWLVAYDGKVHGAWAEAAPTGPASQTMQNGRQRGGTNMRVGTADFSGVK